MCIRDRIDCKPAAVLSLYAPLLSTCTCLSKPPILRSSRIITSSVRDKMTRSVAQRRMYSLTVKHAASACLQMCARSAAVTLTRITLSKGCAPFCSNCDKTKPLINTNTLRRTRPRPRGLSGRMSPHVRCVASSVGASLVSRGVAAWYKGHPVTTPRRAYSHEEKTPCQVLTHKKIHIKRLTPRR